MKNFHERVSTRESKVTNIKVTKREKPHFVTEWLVPGKLKLKQTTQHDEK